MKTYSLSALLKLREHKKSRAQSDLAQALDLHLHEQQTLEQLEMTLKTNIDKRTQMQENFFVKANSSPFNKTAITCHHSLNQKQRSCEKELKTLLSKQQEAFKRASIRVMVAKSTLQDSERNLLILQKHYNIWQRSIKRHEELKQEYENDDQNGCRFVLNKA